MGIVLVDLIVGHESQKFSKTDAAGNNYRWTVFVKPTGATNFADCSLVHKVIFILHESFPNPVRKITHPPFEISEAGYGSFKMEVRVVLSSDKKKEYPIVYDLQLPDQRERYVNKTTQRIGLTQGLPPQMEQAMRRYCLDWKQPETPSPSKEKPPKNKKQASALFGSAGSSSSSSSSSSSGSSDSSSDSSDDSDTERKKTCEKHKKKKFVAEKMPHISPPPAKKKHSTDATKNANKKFLNNEFLRDPKKSSPISSPASSTTSSSTPISTPSTSRTGSSASDKKMIKSSKSSRTQELFSAPNKVDKHVEHQKQRDKEEQRQKMKEQHRMEKQREYDRQREKERIREKELKAQQEKEKEVGKRKEQERQMKEKAEKRKQKEREERAKQEKEEKLKQEREEKLKQERDEKLKLERQKEKELEEKKKEREKLKAMHKEQYKANSSLSHQTSTKKQKLENEQVIAITKGTPSSSKMSASPVMKSEKSTPKSQSSETSSKEGSGKSRDELAKSITRRLANLQNKPQYAEGLFDISMAMIRNGYATIDGSTLSYDLTECPTRRLERLYLTLVDIKK